VIQWCTLICECWSFFICSLCICFIEKGRQPHTHYKISWNGVSIFEMYEVIWSKRINAAVSATLIQSCIIKEYNIVTENNKNSCQFSTVSNTAHKSVTVTVININYNLHHRHFGAVCQHNTSRGFYSDCVQLVPREKCGRWLFFVFTLHSLDAFLV